MPGCSLGVCATSYLSVWQTIDTLDFLERCHSFGAAGIQAVINRDPYEIRARSDKFEMYFEAMVPLPAGGDTAEFERSLRDAKAAGATALRAACLGTRRYESFKTLAEWHAHVARSHESLEAAMPLIDKYKIPLGLENHKDWTEDELVALMQQYSSEYFGVCLDFGNNISLMDLPMETIAKLAPFTVSTHVKDIAVEPDPDGILMSEVVLGKGCIDLRTAVRLIRESRPTTKMTLEMITREPLKIPVLAGEYWATFVDPLPSNLARSLRFVNENKSREPLAHIFHLSQTELNQKEDENVVRCLAGWHSVDHTR